MFQKVATHNPDGKYLRNTGKKLPLGANFQVIKNPF